ncbi:MAG: hypothetical protein ACLSB7_01055 [Parabacteroides distasonis]
MYKLNSINDIYNYADTMIEAAKKIFIMRIITLLIISMGLFLSCGNGKKLPNVGDKVYVVQECLSAVSEDDFAELNKVCNRKDESRLEEMILSEKVFILNPTNECKLIEAKFGKYKIRVKVDWDKEIDLWVASEFIK